MEAQGCPAPRDTPDALARVHSGDITERAVARVRSDRTTDTDVGSNDAFDDFTMSPADPNSTTGRWGLAGPRLSHGGEGVAGAEPSETGCDPLPNTDARPVAGGRTLAMEPRICQLNRHSPRGALRLVVCLKQRRSFMRHPRADTKVRRLPLRSGEPGVERTSGALDELGEQSEVSGELLLVTFAEGG
jgi:hypothetical protein